MKNQFLPRHGSPKYALTNGDNFLGTGRRAMLTGSWRDSLRSVTLVVMACLAFDSAFALTTNPIGPALPLTVHAQSRCLEGTVSYPNNVGNTSVQVQNNSSLANCAGVVLQQNPATLTDIFGNGNAKADLETGTLKATAIGRSYVDSSQALRAGAFAGGSLYDTLTVNGDWTGTRTIELRLTVDGTLTSNAITPNWQSGLTVNSGLLLLSESGSVLGNTGLNITQGNDGTPYITAIGASGATVSTNATNNVFDPNDVQFTLSYLFPATTSNRTFSFVGKLEVWSAMGFGTGLDGTAAEGVVDFGNTGRFSLIVPNDVTVTSASGQFLTAVPVPAAAWLFGSGLLGLIGIARIPAVATETKDRSGRS